MPTYFDIHGNPHERPADIRPVWRVSVYGIAINDQEEVLAVRAKVTNKWELPGGGVEIEENLPEALLREILEETGYRAEKLDDPPELVEQNFFRLSTQEYYHSLRLYYRVHILAKDEQIQIDPTEVTEISWIPLNALHEAEWKDTVWPVMIRLRVSPEKPSPYLKKAIRESEKEISKLSKNKGYSFEEMFKKLSE